MGVVSAGFLSALGAQSEIPPEAIIDQFQNAKDIIHFLRTSSMSEATLVILKFLRYLPAECDRTQKYFPQQLHLPRPELRLFPS